MGLGAMVDLVLQIYKATSTLQRDWIYIERTNALQYWNKEVAWYMVADPESAALHHLVGKRNCMTFANALQKKVFILIDRNHVSSAKTALNFNFNPNVMDFQPSKLYPSLSGFLFEASVVFHCAALSLKNTNHFQTPCPAKKSIS